MKPCAIKNAVVRTLPLLAMAMLVAGCYWGPGGGYPEDPGPGYYGGYPPAFYGGDVVIGVGGGGGGHHDEGHYDAGHRDVSHMPGRRLPAPAPRSTSHSHPAKQEKR